jgi:hypothetical protein
MGRKGGNGGDVGDGGGEALFLEDEAMNKGTVEKLITYSQLGMCLKS